MKKELKRAVKAAYEAPEPVEKRIFLRKFLKPEIGMVEFMLIQAEYIGKGVWLFSIAVLTAALMGVCWLEKDILWAVSSLLPFAALFAVTESARSTSYHMEEMEMATRFSLKSVLLARMGVIGAIHLLLLCALLPLGHMYGERSFFETGVYLLLPYLTVTVLGLWITRKLRGKDAAYGCMGCAVLTSGTTFMMNYTWAWYDYGRYFQEYVILLAVLLVLAAWEYRRAIQRTEELVWNL